MTGKGVILGTELWPRDQNSQEWLSNPACVQVYEPDVDQWRLAMSMATESQR